VLFVSGLAHPDDLIEIEGNRGAAGVEQLNTTTGPDLATLP
jgi:hypothetical protein